MAETGEPDALLAALARLDTLVPPTIDPVTPPPGTTPDDPAGDLAGVLRATPPEGRPGDAGSPPTHAPESPEEHRGPAWIEDRLRRARRLDDRMHAFVWLDPDRARAEALAAPEDAALAGTLVAHKDILLVADQPATAGSAVLAGHVARTDATAVARLRAAGAVSLGKLATHEFATGITGTVSAFPTPVNPRAPDRVPGGSSSGSAVAVAAGLVDVATGTDTGGSIRIPAACCGAVGFKPTRGRVPVAGVIPFSSTLDHVGPIALSVAAVARATEVMADAALDTSRRRRTGRIAWPRTLGSGCTSPVRDALEAAAEGLRERGLEPVPIMLPNLWREVASIAAAIFLAEGARFHAPGLAARRHLYRPETLAVLGRAAAATPARYERALSLRAALIGTMRETLSGFDALLLPALPCPAPVLGQDTVDLPGEACDVRAALTRFTRLANVTGQPALVLPVARADGAPVAVQLLGDPGDDAALLTVAAELEEALGGPWEAEPPITSEEHGG